MIIQLFPSPAACGYGWDRKQMKHCPVCKRVYPDATVTCPEDGASLEPITELLPGSLIRGKYRIVNRIGIGGMATVYRAIHMAFNEERAIKILNDRLYNDSTVTSRFRTEAIITRKLRHPNAVFIEDLDVMDDGRPFIVMELVDGPGLREIIRQNAPLVPVRAIRIAQQVSSALVAAHSVGITHRDTKPENIVLVRNGGVETAKVLDFGIAKVRSQLMDPETTLGTNQTTSLGMIIGTPAYMAPEQAESRPDRPVDGRADIYSLGMVLYELLSGALPFESDTPIGMMFHQVKTQPRELPDVAPLLRDCPELCQVVMRCLRKHPNDRYASASDLVTALNEAEQMILSKAPRLFTTEQRREYEEGYKSSAGMVVRSEPDISSRNTPDPKLEIAHVLAIDIVGHSRLPINAQAIALQELQRLVCSTPDFSGARGDDLVSLQTADGIALSFFSSPEAPIRCAMHIAAAVREKPDLDIRIGLHSGPVFRVRDIKDNINVAGGGINFAERVMRFGDSGHILASGVIADLITQHSTWSESFHELGVAEIMEGVKLRIFNVYTEDYGNPAVPSKLQMHVRAAATSSHSGSVDVLTPPPAHQIFGPSTSSVSLTAEIVERAAKSLAVYIGPIARVIVKRASANCSTVNELYEKVANEIQSPRDRDRFLNSRPRT